MFFPFFNSHLKEKPWLLMQHSFSFLLLGLFSFALFQNHLSSNASFRNDYLILIFTLPLPSIIFPFFSNRWLHVFFHVLIDLALSFIFFVFISKQLIHHESDHHLLLLFNFFISSFYGVVFYFILFHLLYSFAFKISSAPHRFIFFLNDASSSKNMLHRFFPYFQKGRFIYLNISDRQIHLRWIPPHGGMNDMIEMFYSPLDQYFKIESQFNKIDLQNVAMIMETEIFKDLTFDLAH